MGRKSKRSRIAVNASRERWRKKAVSSAVSIVSPLEILADVATAKENPISVLETQRAKILVDSRLDGLGGSQLHDGTRYVKVVDKGRLARSKAQNDSGATRWIKRANTRGPSTRFSERTERRKRMYIREQKLIPITKFFRPQPKPSESPKSDSSVPDASQMKNYPMFSQSKSRGVDGSFVGRDLTSKFNEKVRSSTSKTLKYFDSKAGEGDKHLQNVLCYLKDEHPNKKKVILEGKWELSSLGKGVPQQQNNSDCGFFMLLFCNYLAQDLPCEVTFVKNIRKKIGVDVLKGRILPFPIIKT